MKNGISDILNSLFSSPSDKAALLKGNGAVSPKGSQSNGSTFEDVLAQLATHEAGNSNSSGTADSNAKAASLGTGNNGNFFESLTSISKVDITISEHLKVGNLDQLAKAEQSLTSLAVGLAKLLSLLSNLQSSDLTQAQNTLVSVSGGTISPDDAKSLLAALQSMTQKLSDSQNPLLLTSDQQSAFLNQMLQQMLQNQQLLFGTAVAPSSTGNSISSAGGVVGASNGFQTSDLFLQMAFSDTQITQVQQTNTQSSQVFINLQTFQMAATFVQVGSGESAGQNLLPGTATSFQPVSLPDTQALFNALDQTLQNQALSTLSAITSPQAASQNASSNTASAQDLLNRNFKNLVQMLFQAGASQAVLTSLLNQQKDLSGADLKQSLSQNVSMDSLLRSITPNVAILPVSQTESTAISNNGADNTRPTVNGQMIVEQMFAQASIAAVETQITPAVVSDSQKQGQQMPIDSNLVSSPQAAQVLPPGSLEKAPVVDIQGLNTLNNVVARLNVLAAQGTETNLTALNGNNPLKQSPSLEQLLSNLNLRPSGLPMDTTGNESNPQVNPSLIQVSAATPTLNRSGISQPQISIKELTAVNQIIQTQAIFNRPIDTSSNQPPIITVQQNVLDVTSVSQAQLIHSANTAIAENQVLSQLAANQPLTSTAGITSNPILNNPLLLNGQVINAPATGQTIIPSAVLPVGQNNQLPVILNNQVQPVLTNAAPVANQPQPVSPVSITVQETVPPNAVDVQVKVTDQIPVSASFNIQAPAATTTATTVAVSTAQNVPASVVTGEVAKLSTQTPLTLKNNDLNNLAANNFSTVSEVKPISQQAVSPVALGSNVFTDLKASIDLSKNTNNNSTNLQPIPAQLINPANLAPLTNTLAGSNQLSNSVSALKIDSFQILNQVTDQISAHASEARAVSRLSFQLIPESLGRVTVQIALVDQSVSARIIVSNPDVRDSLQHHMIDLKTALNQAGLQIDQLQVQVQGGSSNLLAQYYQYQQEGFGYRLPATFSSAPVEEPKTLENSGVLGEMSVRMSLVDVLA